MERLSASDFTDKHLDRPGRWAVCFLADWCPFCQDFRPKFEAFTPPANVRMARVDVTDLESPLWERFGVDVVPTLATIIDGELTWRRDGLLGRGLSEKDLADLDRALRSKK